MQRAQRQQKKAVQSALSRRHQATQVPSRTQTHTHTRGRFDAIALHISKVGIQRRRELALAGAGKEEQRSGVT